MRFKLKFVVVPALVSLVLTLGVVGSSSADSPQPDGPPDKGKHTWCYMSGFTVTATADAAMTWLRTQTAVDTAYYSTCTAKTDVRWSQGSLPSAYGMAECKVRDANDYCDRYRITLDTATIDGSLHPDSQRRKTSCHELGHTVGVRHYSNSDYPGSDTTHSCLRSGEVPAADKAWHTRYGAHHRTFHIDPWFS